MTIPRFAFWNPGTWQIPKLYWDAFSDEQRIHAICKQLGKVIAYADYLGINVEDIASRLEAIEAGQLDDFIVAAIEEWFDDNQPAIVGALDALNDALPISDFDSVNTVKSALNAIDARFPVDTADIADGAITTDKIADDAITAAKIDAGAVDTAAIADEAITEEKISPALKDMITRFDSSVKADILPAITDGWVTLFSGRLFEGTTIAHNFQPQGMAYREGCLYVAMINNQSNYVDIYKFDRANNTVGLFASNIFMGHCNTMTFSPATNKFYVLPGQSNLGDSDPQFYNVVFSYDVNFANREIIQCPGTVGTISYDYALEKMTYADNATGYVYDFDETTKQFTKRDVEFPNRDVVYNTPSSNEVYIFQGGAIYNDFYCVTVGWNGLRDPNVIVVYDLKNGTLAKCYQYPECTDIFPIGEGEDLAFDEYGMLYINGGTNYSLIANVEAQTTIFRSGIFCDMVSGSSVNAVYPTNITVKNSSMYNPIAGTGAGALVFKQINEAALYAKYHKTGLIAIERPDDSADPIYWYNAMLMLSGLDLSIQLSNNVGIQGQLFIVNNARIIWYNTLRMRLPYGITSNAFPIRCYQSTLIGDILHIYPGYSTEASAIQYLNCGMLCLSAQPTLEAGVAGTAISVSRNNGFGYRFTPFTGQ